MATYGRGNLAWTADEEPIPIDWKSAGVGHPGVDLGELRKQVAMHFGPEAPAHVLEGWEGEMGLRAPDVAYWDVVATLNTPTSLSGWPAHDSDGTPLQPDGATQRRDAFLAAALDQL